MMARHRRAGKTVDFASAKEDKPRIPVVPDAFDAAA
jgi:hypothetical protein